MNKVDSNIWGQPLTQYDSMNNRTGATDLNDPDFEDFPPFVKNNIAALGSNPSGGLVSDETLYMGLINNPTQFDFRKPIDETIAYCACKNPEIFINNIGVPIPGPLARWQEDIEPSRAFNFKTKSTEPIPIVFFNSYGFMHDKTNNPSASAQFNNPYYLQGTNRINLLYVPNGDNIGNTSTQNEVNTSNNNLFYSYWRDFGIRSLFGTIYVHYFDNTYSSTTGLPQNVARKSLHDYETQTDEWKSNHRILAAYMSINFRRSTDGAYNNSTPASQCFIPDFTTQLYADSSVFGSEVPLQQWQPHASYVKNSGSYFPIFGSAHAGNTALSSIGYQAVWVSQMSGGGTAQASNLLVGINTEIEGIAYGHGLATNDTGRRSYWVEMEGTAENLERIRKTAAAYGLFFTDGANTETGYNQLYAEGNDETRWTDEKMCLGVVDDEGYTDGTYTRGTNNEDANNFNWKTASESKYDPSRPPPSPDPTTADILPSGLDWTLAGSGTNIYALNPSEIQRAWQDVFGSGVDVKQFGNQPMNAILSLKWTPFDWTYTGIQHEKPIILGVQEANPLHTYKVIEVVSDAQKHMNGIVNFKFNKNFFNARYMQARLFLPFYGYYELPTAQLLSSDLQLDFYYNIPDELGVWFISYRQADSNQWVIYDYCECAIDMEVPLTGNNAAQISASRKQEALTIATQIASAAATVAVGGSTLFGIGQAARHLAQGIDAIADVGLGWGSGGIDSEAYLGMRGAGTGWMAKAGTAAGAIGAGVGAAIGIYNTINNARIERAALRTNLPYHGSALQTTFLHLSMVPYVQIFKNNIMQPLSTTGNDVSVELGGNEKTDYMLKVGHACDIWSTLDNMPARSLCQTTGIANMDTTGLELSEVQELNSILQSGFYKSI